MGSTGEPDRKRRHFASIYPTAAVAAKKQPPTPSSEDKKLDVAVLKYKNQKLVEQLEAQKVQYLALENKFNQLKEKQKDYSNTLAAVNQSWEQIVDDLESCSACTSRSRNLDLEQEHYHIAKDGTSSSTPILMEQDFLSRLLETGATESSGSASPDQWENGERMKTSRSSTKRILQNILSSHNNTWQINKDLVSALLVTLREDEPSRQLHNTANDLLVGLNNVLQVLDCLHLRHRQLAGKIEHNRDLVVRNTAEFKRLTEELATTVAELEEINHKLATLKAQRDVAQGTPILFPTLGTKNIPGDQVRDKQKELQDLEATRKELVDLASSRLIEIRRLHDERIEVLKKLATFQNILTDLEGISSSKAFQLLSDQLQKSKTKMEQCLALLENLQVEKDNFSWQEKEVTIKVDLADISRSVYAFSDSRIAELDQELPRLAEEKILLEAKLEEILREPGRKEIISEFKALVSTLPKEMGVMQSEINKCKEASSELHSLRAEVQSLSSILNWEENELESLSGRSTEAVGEIKRLQAAVRDIRRTNQELKLFLEMYICESTDSRDVMESRDREYKAWALVQSLKSSLDEHKLEVRVKAAIEAEAVSQQGLAAAEADIVELRKKLESSRRDLDNLLESLKSKNEEGNAYLSEIESIGHAYEDMLSQNQHLLQQITERDDHNTKLVMEGLKARQVQRVLLLEVRSLDKKLQHVNSLMDLCNLKIVRLDEQLKVLSEQVGKLAEERWQNSVSLENAQRKLVDVQGNTQQIRRSVDGVQAKVGQSRMDVAELLVELEKERFNKKRLEQDIEVTTRKASSLRSGSEESTVLEKLRHEAKEYRGILKCGICHDRQKEVVIAKCYHLFCNWCVQKSLHSRQRKCPTCSSSFGPNDVKPIYM